MSLNGIILRVTPYQERGLILLVFTEEEGILPCFLSMTKREPYAWVEPFIAVKGKMGDRRGKLVHLKELVGEKWFWGLRDKPDAVKTLYSMRDNLLKIIEEENPLPLVYLLFEKIMEGLETGLDPKTMEALFLVKLALHEGVLDLDNLEEKDREWVKKAAETRSLATLPIHSEFPSSLLQGLCFENGPSLLRKSS
jgi:recombinational DNA repair protein (RecF pathway)